MKWGPRKRTKERDGTRAAPENRSSEKVGETMTSSPINTLPGSCVRVLAPSSSFSSSSAVPAISQRCFRILFAAPSSPSMVMLTLNPRAQKRVSREMEVFRDVDIADFRSGVRVENLQQELVNSDKKQFEEEVPVQFGRKMEKKDKSVASQKGSYYNYKRRRSFWAEVDLTVGATASNWGKIVLSRGMSESLRLLLSLSLLRSILRFLNMLLLFLLMPFNGSGRNFVLSSKRPDNVEQKGGREIEEKEESGSTSYFKVSSVKVSMNNALPHSVDSEVSMRREMAIQRVREDKDGTDKTTREFSFFVTPRGATLFTQSWTPVSSKAKGLIVLLHGLNEHSGRYNNFARRLNLIGFKVYGLDWVGHGGSDGLHGYLHSLDDAVSDVKSFLDEVLSKNLGMPCFCFGHSTGGAILLKAALDPRFEAKLSGLILTSPAIGVQASHPIYTILAPLASILLPRYQCGAANKKGAVVSRDPDALIEKYSDPLVYTGSLRARTGYEILRTSNYLQRNLRRLTVPFFVLHGTADVITNPGASEKLYMEASSADKRIKLYEGLLHDLLFEPEREIIIHDIMEWLSDRV